MDIPFDIPRLDSTPEGYKKCSCCKQIIPVEGFDPNPMLGGPQNVCKGCYDDMVPRLAIRLAWYVSKQWPANIPSEMGSDLKSIKAWLLKNRATVSGAKVVMYAKNMRTPAEEAESLVRRGLVGSVDELRSFKPDGEADPIMGYRERYQEFEKLMERMVSGQ